MTFKVLLILLKCLYFVGDLLIPKKKTFVFTSKAGKELKGNASALYTYLKERKKEVYFIDRPYKWRSLWILLRTNVVFLTHGPGDVPYAFHSFRKNVVYLGHGIPIKNMLFEDRSLTWKSYLLSGIESRFYSHVIASSDSDQSKLSHIFRLPTSKVFVTGLPRNDHLFDVRKRLEDVFHRNEIYILYAPTYRSYGPTKLFPFSDLDLNYLNNFLSQNKLNLVIRTHPNDKGLNRSLFEFSHILDGGNNMISDVQDYLSDFDAVITDYSSIYIDYLLTNKPVAFIPYDLDTYLSRTGLLYEYQEVTPGPHINSQSGFINFLKTIVSSEDSYKEERARVRKIFFAYEDQKACERVLKLFE